MEEAGQPSLVLGRPRPAPLTLNLLTTPSVLVEARVALTEVAPEEESWAKKAQQPLVLEERLAGLGLSVD